MPSRPSGPRERGSALLPAGVRRERIEPLWDRIDRNRVRVAVFLTAFVAAVALSVALLSGAALLVLGVVLVRFPTAAIGYWQRLPAIMSAAVAFGVGGALAYLVRALAAPERRLLQVLGAVRTGVGELADVKANLYDMSLASGRQHPPWLWVLPDCDRVNAFVIGRDAEHAAVGVTQGFVDRLGDDEQRAVFANLMARLGTGATLWATVVSAVMGPIWWWRERSLTADDRPPAGDVPEAVQPAGRGAPTEMLAWFLVGSLAAFVTELLMAGHQRAAMAAAEKADAEGMLLLKDPRSMLRGLTTVLEHNNTVVSAGETYSMLFYCWAGFGYAPEDDPEMARVSRLREVLGAAGMVDDEMRRDGREDEAHRAPRAPRIEEADGA